MSALHFYTKGKEFTQLLDMFVQEGNLPKTVEILQDMGLSREQIKQFVSGEREFEGDTREGDHTLGFVPSTRDTKLEILLRDFSRLLLYKQDELRDANQRIRKFKAWVYSDDGSERMHAVCYKIGQDTSKFDHSSLHRDLKAAKRLEYELNALMTSIVLFQEILGDGFTINGFKAEDVPDLEVLAEERILARSFLGDPDANIREAKVRIEEDEIEDAVRDAKLADSLITLKKEFSKNTCESSWIDRDGNFYTIGRIAYPYIHNDIEDALFLNGILDKKKSTDIGKNLEEMGWIKISDNSVYFFSGLSNFMKVTKAQLRTLYKYHKAKGLATLVNGLGIKERIPVEDLLDLPLDEVNDLLR